ncbi:MAG: hypothetical protein U0892_10925 [Pirellulales bacterium]
MIVAFRLQLSRIRLCIIALLLSMPMSGRCAEALLAEQPIRIALIRVPGPLRSDPIDSKDRVNDEDANNETELRRDVGSSSSAISNPAIRSLDIRLSDSSADDDDRSVDETSDTFAETPAPELTLPHVRKLVVTLSECGSLRSCDEVFEVSTRCLPTLPKCSTIEPVAFQVSKLDSSGWKSITDGEFQGHLDADPGRRTAIYVHGNWMEAGNARNRGTYVYNRLSQRCEEPLRVILYSWPSQRDGRPIKDVLEKAARADVETYYFAHLLSRLPKDSPLGILGFSFGARVVGGGLHLANGGSFHGRSLTGLVEREHVRVSVVAPAFDRNWLMHNQPYGMAIQNVDSLVNVYNSRDPVLRRFRFIDSVTSPIAAGFSGLPDPRSTHPLAADAKIRQYDCSGCVGNSHDEMTYYRSCTYYNHAIDNVLGK